MSGSFKLNGTEFLMQPTTHRWLPRPILGVDGNGHAIYPGVREFEMRFNLQSPNEYNQLLSWFRSQEITGSATLELPGFGFDSYNFVPYSGCAVREPEMDVYFNENHSEVVLLITNIRLT
jgi:hypothetical protein